MLPNYETRFFYGMLKTCDKEICKIIATYNVLSDLTERNEMELLYTFIKSKYVRAGISFPVVFDELKENEDLFRDFMCDLLADLEEIIEEDFGEMILQKD